MMKSDVVLLVTMVITTISPALYGMLGSVGFYLHELSQDPSGFDWFTLFIYSFLGVVVGLLVHNMTLDLLDASYPGLIIAAGFSVRRMANIADRYLGLRIKLPKK